MRMTDELAPRGSEESNRRMIDVYAAIYGDHYALDPASVSVSRTTIRNDAALLGLSSEACAKQRVLTIGTGREAVALHELGFREVCHADLAPAAVQAVTSLRERSPHHRNLHSARVDVCDAAIPFDAPFDLIYLNGVVHHLRDPAAALENLTACAAPRAILFFRIYRSGSLLFFTVDFLRRFLRYGDRTSFAAAVTDRAWIAGVPWMAMDMWDDFFVPVLGLYRADDVARYLRGRGWIPRLPLPSLSLDHSDPGGTPDSIALAFDRAPSAVQECDEFPPSVDQLREVHRHGSETMRATVAAMERALPALAAAPSPARVAAAMDLYWIARRPAVESADERHAALREILEPFAQTTSESR